MQKRHFNGWITTNKRAFFFASTDADIFLIRYPVNKQQNDDQNTKTIYTNTKPETGWIFLAITFVSRRIVFITESYMTGSESTIDNDGSHQH